VAHVAINADDVEATKRFYETVFGWRFVPWGPPDFFRLDKDESDGAPMVALQGRRELDPGVRITGFECTVGVEDVDAVAKAVTGTGGRILMEKTTIAGVGHLIWFADPSGNVCGAMEYRSDAE
jgi:predicted enzyme related to lactoylglutathione lyase